MALPNSGAISFSMLNLQLHRPEMQQISLDDPQVRGLAGKTSGVISLDDLRGKHEGAMMTCAKVSIDQYGFKVNSSPGGNLVGVFGGVAMEYVIWHRVDSSNSYLRLATVTGAAKPSATSILIRDSNFGPILQRTINSWSLSNMAWKASVLISTQIPNPFPDGSTRWIS